jgi:hypothetical protein
MPACLNDVVPLVKTIRIGLIEQFFARTVHRIKFGPALSRDAGRGSHTDGHV